MYMYIYIYPRHCARKIPANIEQKDKIVRYKKILFPKCDRGFNFPMIS